MSIWPQFSYNLIWKVDNGQSIKIWSDHWLPGVQNLGDFAIRELNGNDHSQKLAEFITSEMIWDWDRLSTILPNDCLELLIPIKAPDPLAGQDILAWFPTIY